MSPHSFPTDHPSPCLTIRFSHGMRPCPLSCHHLCSPVIRLPLRSGKERRPAVRDCGYSFTEHLFNNTLHSDAVFVVDGKRIPVHTHLLRLNSCIVNNLSASDVVKNRDYVIAGVCLSPFMSLLRWIYCREVVLENGHRSLVEVMTLASTYKVRSLLNEAKKHESLIWILVDHAMRCENETEHRKLWERITSNTEMLVESKDFLVASPAVLKKLTSFITLNIREIDLFKACCKWSIAECKRMKQAPNPKNQRKVMEPFLKQFAFPSMNPAEFAAGCSEILTESEQLSVVYAMVGVEVETSFRRSQNVGQGEHVSAECDHVSLAPGSRTPRQLDPVMTETAEGEGRTRKRTRPSI